MLVTNSFILTMKDTEVDYEEREERKMGNWRFKGKVFLIGHQYNI